jgi:hypothetical protein
LQDKNGASWNISAFGYLSTIVSALPIQEAFSSGHSGTQHAHHDRTRLPSGPLACGFKTQQHFAQVFRASGALARQSIARILAALSV